MPQIIEAAIQVHRELGPGLLEAYEVCLCHELSLNVKLLKQGIRRLII
jgi:GxxExxY protein